MLFFYFFIYENKWIFSGLISILFLFLLVVLITFVFTSISVKFYVVTKAGQKVLYSQLVAGLTTSFSLMNFFFKAQLNFKKPHSLDFQELNNNFQELKKKNFGTFVFSIFLSFLLLFLALSFLNLGVMVFLGILNSLFNSNSVSFYSSVVFLLMAITLNMFLFFIPKTQEMKEYSKFWGVVIFGSIFFGPLFLSGFWSFLTIFFNWLTMSMAI